MLQHLADAPIEVIVQSSTPGWMLWLPIAVSLLSLAVSGSQFFINRAERKRIMPTIAIRAVFWDKFKYEGADKPSKVVWVKITNTGRDSTNLIDVRLHTGSRLFSAAHLLRDKFGDAEYPEALAREIPGFSATTIFIDASSIDRSDVGLTAEFGHGLEKHRYLALNGGGKEMGFGWMAMRLKRSGQPDLNSQPARDPS